jgi:hypothetical protein
LKIIGLPESFFEVWNNKREFRKPKENKKRTEEGTL